MNELDSISSQPAFSAEVKPPATNVRWMVFALACGTSFMLYLHRYSWNIIGPRLQAEYELDNSQTAILFSLFYYTYASGQIPSGVLIDRLGPHRFLSVIIAAWSVALAGIAWTGNIIVLGIWRLLFGATQAGCYPALTKISQQWFAEHQRTVLQGWVATTFGRAGGAMSPIILGTLLIGWWGFTWQVALTAISAVGLLHCVIFYACFRDTPELDSRVNAQERRLLSSQMPGDDTPHATATEVNHKPDSHGISSRPLSPKVALQNHSLRWFTVQQFLDAGSDVMFVGLMGTYFLNAHSLKMAETGWLASMPLWGGAVGGIVGGWLNDMLIRRTGSRRWARSGVGFVGKVIGSVMAVLVVVQPTAFQAGCLLMAAKFFSDWSQPTTWGTCTDLGGRYSATVFSIINTAGTIGGVVMPVVFGVVLDKFETTTLVGDQEIFITNWTPLFALLATMYLISGACWLMVDCTQQLAPASSEQPSS